MLLEIFDSYRQRIDHYDHWWREKYAWFSLAHVCRRWRAIAFASSSRLDLGITVGPVKPGHIKTILSSPLPISIDYRFMYKGITASAIWRMRAALKHRVRNIAFSGASADFDRLFKDTKCSFPELESLLLEFDYACELNVLDAVQGPGPYPRLRRLRLESLNGPGVSLASISGILSSATALTDLFLHINTTSCSSAETLLLACLQGMPRLCILHLSLPHNSTSQPSDPSTPQNIVPLSKLTCFLFVGNSLFLDALAAGLSTPSLQDVDFEFYNDIWPPITHLPRFIDEIKEHYHVVHVALQDWHFHLSLLTQSEYNGHCKPRFKFGPVLTPYSQSIMQISSALSTRLTTVAVLRVTFDETDTNVWENVISWRRFLQQFSSVKTLCTEGPENTRCITRTLCQNIGEPEDLAFLPALEEIDLGKDPLNESQRKFRLATFQPFVSARQQGGRPVKIFFST